MKIAFLSGLMMLGQLLLAQTRYDVASLEAFKTAQEQATAGDSIVWQSGTYSDVFMDITKAGLVVTAEAYGSVTFNGDSKVEIPVDDVTFSGFQYVGGDIGTDHVVRVWGSDVLVTQVNIQDYTSYKYLIIDEDSKRTIVSYCNFENRINLDDQNILSILVDTEPGYHKVQYCSFKNFNGTGNDMGIEPVRIGVSSQAHLDSRSLVEYCYFTHCDGDGELISNKAGQNVFRYNTFENNTKAELVLRHGDEGIVYGNFFLNNMGGVRVREGSGHFIYNNYFSGLSKRAIYLQNESSDPLSDIHIYFNTVLNSQEVRLGGSGSNPPQNVTFANNIFSDPQDGLFDDATGTETWLGNIAFGDLGVTRKSGMANTDPQLEANEHGFMQLKSSSPAIDAAENGYPVVPLFEGMDYDHEILLDLMKRSRPQEVASRDVGAVEYDAEVVVRPLARAENSGPVYLTNAGQVTVTVVAATGGEVELEPTQESYLPGTQVTARAISDAEHLFSHWEGDVSGTENPLTFFVHADMEIKAVFEVGTLSSDLSENWGIYPNPVVDQLTVHAPVQASFWSWEVISMDGKTVLKQDSVQVNDKLHIETKALPRGMYFLHLRHYEPYDQLAGQHRFKFMKE
ncbi:chondroitinase-B domain-containing protein [Marinoscillum furvescens]|uniref:Putative secreted protein (Por secretion system target) n=1 Tax=Marinoscillum furvescens DSM 4134 TaxID=1122208 RepID=A0A3D9KZF7_MARFU|nr:chondroitinase-B domain-containing protein [Marinoscillum furvescens]RED95296.1 putative secreted protein (Por secretion system target) [Marinoscillum furvescens DSM 4134]